MLYGTDTASLATMVLGCLITESHIVIPQHVTNPRLTRSMSEPDRGSRRMRTTHYSSEVFSYDSLVNSMRKRTGPHSCIWALSVGRIAPPRNNSGLIPVSTISVIGPTQSP